jgi:hypothetical protein
MVIDFDSLCVKSLPSLKMRWAGARSLFRIFKGITIPHLPGGNRRGGVMERLLQGDMNCLRFISYGNTSFSFIISGKR